MGLDSLMEQVWVKHLMNGHIHEMWVSLSTTYTPFELGVYGTFLLSFWVYWIPCMAFLMIDVFKPSLLYKYKLQPHMAPSNQLIIKGIALVLFNQFFVTFPLGYCFGTLMWPRNKEEARLELPTLVEIMTDFIVFIVIEEVCFYYSHRLAHHPALYKHVHKVHHHYTAPIALSAQYAHPIEQVISNVTPVFMGPLLMQSHILTFWLWTSLALINTLNAHCGYDLPFHKGQAIFHDFHHEKFNYCFGVFGVLDWLHGTDSLFRKRYGLDNTIPFGGLLLKTIDYKSKLKKAQEQKSN